MVHVPYVTPLLKVELLVSTVVIAYLLLTAITKKDMILSETAFSRLTSNWPKFKTLFYTGVVGLTFFIIIVALEFAGQINGAGFHTFRPAEIELAKVGLVTSFIAFSLLNIYLVNILIGGGE